jgi:hypothetical protein
MEVETCVRVDVPVYSQLVNVRLLDLFSSVLVRWLGLIVDKKSRREGESTSLPIIRLQQFAMDRSNTATDIHSC